MDEKKKRQLPEMDDDTVDFLMYIGVLTGFLTVVIGIFELAEFSPTFGVILSWGIAFLISSSFVILWGWCIHMIWLRYQRSRKYFEDDDDPDSDDYDPYRPVENPHVKFDIDKALSYKADDDEN